MSFVKKYAPKFIIVMMILTFIVAMFYAIFRHIDGSGIFGIVLGIIFFSGIFYKLSKSPTTSSTNIIAADNGSPISNVIKLISSPVFIRVLPSILTVIFAYLERHKHKLNRTQADTLEQEIEALLDKFKNKPS